MRRDVPLVPAFPPRLPFIVRTLGDVEVLRNSPGSLRRLPARGIPVSLSGVASERAREFEERLRAYIRTCGCAEGGIAGVLGVATVLSWGIASIIPRGFRLGDIGFLFGALMVGVLLGGLGKTLGLALARIRFVRSCDRILRDLK
jgi:hypothetical protein